MSNEASLVFYLLSFSFSAFLMWRGLARNNKLIIAASLLIPIIISGWRFNVGTDYTNYVLMFNDLSKVPIDQYFSQVFPKTEIGFYALIKLSSWLADGPFLMFFASAALTVLFFFFGLKKYELKHASLIYLLYMLIIFPTTLNGIRQGIATAVCFYAITFILSRKPAKYFLWILIASLFHVSALFLIPLYLLNLIIKGDKKDLLIKTVLTFCCTILVLFLLLPYAFDLLSKISIFESYVQYLVPVNDGTDSGFYSKMLIVATVAFASKWIIPNEYEARTKYHYFILLVVLDILISTLGFSATIDRMALYFSFFSIFLIVSFIDIFRDISGKAVMYSLIIAYGIAYFYIAYYIQNYGDVTPYDIIR